MLLSDKQALTTTRLGTRRSTLAWLLALVFCALVRHLVVSPFALALWVPFRHGRGCGRDPGVRNWVRGDLRDCRASGELSGKQGWKTCVREQQEQEKRPDSYRVSLGRKDAKTEISHASMGTLIGRIKIEG